MRTDSGSFVPLTVGHIRVSTLLGRGAMGDVYLGFDEALQRRVALKFIPQRLRLDPEHKTRLLSEARILSRLDHHNICRIYDVVEEIDGEILVLEYIQGVTLRTWLQGEHSFRERLELAIQIVDALSAAHDQGITHRDLKPENIMVTEDNRVKVLDFGLARSDQQGLQIAQETLEKNVDDAYATSPIVTSYGGQMVGTVMYMSPEQARAEPATPLSDVFSLGLTLQHLFTKLPPYTNSNRGELIKHVMAGKTNPISGVDRDVRQTLRQMLQAEAIKRPNAREVLARLQKIKERPVRRLKRLIILAIALSALVGVFRYTYVVKLERERAESARQDAESLVNFLIDDLYDDLEGIGRLDLMERVLSRANRYYVDTTQQGKSPETKARQVWIQEREARLKIDLGRIEQALVSVLSVIQMREQLIKEHPTRDDWAFELGESYYTLGYLHLSSGDRESAGTAYDRAIEIHRQLAQQHPDDINRQIQYIRSLVGLGSIYLAENENENALQVFEQSLEVSEQLSHLHPDNKDVLRKYGVDLFSVAEAERFLSRFAEAASHYSQALAVDRKLAELYPEHAQHEIDITYDLQAIAQTYLMDGNAEAALPHASEAHRRGLALVEHEPLNVEWTEITASIEYTLGELHDQLGQREKAMSYWQASLARLEPLLEETDLLDARNVYIHSAFALGQRDELKPHLQKFLDVQTKDSDLLAIAKSLDMIE